jgi:hypothetical protein
MTSPAVSTTNHRFLDTTILPAVEFNLIPDIHEQVDFPTEIDVIAAFADVFERHKVQDRFGIHLLHRHFLLPDGNIMLKSPPSDPDISLTQTTPLSSVDVNSIRGALYLLNKSEKFQAYEFEHGEPVDIPTAFLEAFSAALIKFGLTEVVALDIGGGQENRTFPKALEYTVGDTATITVEARDNVESHRVTGLTFVIKEDGKYWGEATDGYSKNVRGTHTVMYEKSLNSKVPGSADECDIGDPVQLRNLLMANGIL